MKHIIVIVFTVFYTNIAWNDGMMARHRDNDEVIAFHYAVARIYVLLLLTKLVERLFM